MADSFILLNLKEKQSKQLAQVMSNETARKILDFLSEKEFTTESDCSKELKLPLSTVHYNFKALNVAGLVTADEFHYSEKGKEVPHYKLANKLIIIAPKQDEKALDRLKKFWPITAIALIAAFAVEAGRLLLQKTGAASQYLAVAPKAFVADDMAMRAGMVMEESTNNLTAVATNAAMAVPPEAPLHAVQSGPSVAAWFLGGALFVILLLVVWELLRRNKKL